MKNSRYALVDIIKESNPLFQSNPTLGEFIYIALIKDSKQEQPFRLVVENFEDLKEAESQIKLWIKCREEEDACATGEMAREATNAKADENLSKLKKTFVK
jgi:hypothetical protein